jgi:hypothetical protein
MHRGTQRLLVLACTVVVAACGGQSKQSSGTPSTQKGTFGSNYYINLFNPPVGGVVTSDVGGITCGASAATVVNGQYSYTYYAAGEVTGVTAAGTACGPSGQTLIPWAQAQVTLKAFPGTGYMFVQWAGDCSGTGDCILTPGSDKTVVAVFGPAGSRHPIPYPGTTHKQDFSSGKFVCTNCHGDLGQGTTNAPSCFTCHTNVSQPAVTAGHFDPASAAWDSHEASGACVRCHTNDGFQDYVGVDGKPNNFDGTFLANGTVFMNGPMKCAMCHNTVTDPATAGLTKVEFTSLATVTGLDKDTALCSQCHQGRNSTPQVNSSITAAVASASRGLGIASATAGAAGTTTTLVRDPAGTAYTADAYKGYTILFTNNGNQGAKPTVSGNTTSTITFAPAVTVATAGADTATGRPADTATMWPTATGGTGDSNPAKGFSMPSITRGIDVKDTNRGTSWTANKWVGYYVYMQTGLNAGLYRKIQANTADTLTVSTATLGCETTAGVVASCATGTGAATFQTGNPGMPFPSVVQAGDLYQIVIKEDSGTGALQDAISTSIKFANPHYASAAATMQGSDARVGYQYATNWGSGNPSATAGTSITSYADRNFHGVSQASCLSCHDPHAPTPLTVTVSTCGRCHFNENGTPVSSMTELEDARQFGFGGDIDGNGTLAPLKDEISGLGALLFKAIRNYAALKLKPICYSAATNPYWFNNTDTADTTGVCTAAEAIPSNVYDKYTDPVTAVASNGNWTPRLVRAAYNYQYLMKEPAAWAHNPRYIIEMLYDATRDLNIALPATAGPDNGGQVGYACVAVADVPSRTSGGAFQISPKPATFTPLGATTGLCTAPATKWFTAVRSFSDGHFQGMAGPFRSRDTTVNTAGGWGYPCLRCHGGQDGLQQYLPTLAGTNNFLDNTASYGAAVPGVQGMQCTTCHDPLATDGDMKRLRAIPGVRFPGHSASGQILNNLSTTLYATVLPATAFAVPADMICSSCHDGRDINGAANDKYLDGTWSGFDVPGSKFFGGGSIVNNGGFVQVAGLPAYQGPLANLKGTPNNWLFDDSKSTATAKQIGIGKFVTISGATSNPSYNGTWAITGTTIDGRATLNLAYAADEAIMTWSAWAAGSKNTHDIQSAARVFGSAVKGGYEYSGKTYFGAKQHHGQPASCVECHSPFKSRHTMEVGETVNAGGCTNCHAGTDYENWAPSRPSLAAPGLGYDNDVTTTTLKAEVKSFRIALAKAMNAYATSVTQTTSASSSSAAVTNGKICWDDTNAGFRAVPTGIVGYTDGVCPGAGTSGAAGTGLAYPSWASFDAKLARASFNMLFADEVHDPGAWAHNFNYVTELLYDSAVDLGGTAAVTGLTRP